MHRTLVRSLAAVLWLAVNAWIVLALVWLGHVSHHGIFLTVLLPNLVVLLTYNLVLIWRQAWQDDPTMCSNTAATPDDSDSSK